MLLRYPDNPTPSPPFHDFSPKENSSSMVSSIDDDDDDDDDSTILSSNREKLFQDETRDLGDHFPPGIDFHRHTIV